MSTNATYDDLMKHVLSLEMENSQLRHELLYGSSGLIEVDQVFKAPVIGDGSPGINDRPADAVGIPLKIKSPSQEHTNSSLQPNETFDVETGNSGVLMQPVSTPVNATSTAATSTSRSVAPPTTSVRSVMPTSSVALTTGGVLGTARDLAAYNMSDQGFLRQLGHSASKVKSHDNLLDSSFGYTGTKDRAIFDPRGLAEHAAAVSKLVTIATQTSDCDIHNPLLSLDPAQYVDGVELYNEQNLAAFCHGGWLPISKVNTSQSDESLTRMLTGNDAASMRSFSSSTNATASSSCRAQQQQLGTKVEVVYSLLSMLGTHDKDDMSQTLLAMSNSQDSCVAMRQSGCIKLLIQLLHDTGSADSSSGQLGAGRGCRAARARAAKALRNIVCSNPDSQRSRREERVLCLLEQIRAHSDELRGSSPVDGEPLLGGQENRPVVAHNSSDADHHVGPAVAAVMKLSFNEEYRSAISTLGGLQAIADLLQLENESQPVDSTDMYSITLRRYACMVLTNLTYGDADNKSLLCSIPGAIGAIVAQLGSGDEELKQVAASVLRNLSWRADSTSKLALRDASTVSALTRAALTATKESTLKSVLSALWNVSAHCSENKAEVCNVPGALEFLVAMLELHGSSTTPIIAENAGGVLCNVSSYIAVHEEHRAALRRAGALSILLRQLRSPSLTVVSNACGTLWNLSARCTTDQRALRDLGAVAMLKSLVNSRHRMIAMGSMAALKNLLSSSSGSATAVGNGSAEQQRRNATLDSVDLERQQRSGGSGQMRHVRSQDGDITAQTGTGHMDLSSMKDRFFDDRALADPKIAAAVRSGLFSHGRTRSELSSSGRELNASSDAGQAFGGFSSGVEPKPRPNGQSFYLAPVDGHFGSHSVDSSPAVHRRPIHGMPSGSQSFIDSATAGFQQHVYPVMYTSWNNGSQVNRSAAAAATSTAVPQTFSDDLDLSRLSRRAENVQLTELVVAGDDEEPVDFSVKYNVESPPATSIARQAVVLPPSQQQTTSHIQQQPMTYLPPGHAVSHQVTSRPNFVRPSQIPPQTVAAGYGAQMLTSQPANRYVAHRMDLASGGKCYEADETASVSESDQTKDYSLQYAERYEESAAQGGLGYEQPIDYSRRYMEPVMTSNVRRTEPTDLRPKMAAAAAAVKETLQGFDDEDTLKTFCTEGTPMNYLSTATSMNDLTANRSTSGSVPQRPHCITAGRQADSAAEDELKDFSSKFVERDMSSSSGTRLITQANGIQIASHWPAQPIGSGYGGVKTSMNAGLEQRQIRPDDARSHGSNASSLSSLKSSEVLGCNSADVTVIRNGGRVAVGPESSAAEMMANGEPKLDISSSSKAAATAINSSKTVTFDVENNQVQETPLMFSRCSSLGSLSSFDVRSIHSSVVSEYSVRASQVVSPSELPDSPCDTMPPSPTRKDCRASSEQPVQEPVKDETGPSAFFVGGGAAVDAEEAVSKSSCNVQSTGKSNGTLTADVSQNSANELSSSSLHGIFSDESSPMRYCDEGNMSSRSSLSALTVDGEKIQVCRELRSGPLGQETKKVVSSFTSSQPNNEKVNSLNEQMANDSLEDYDNDSPVSEGEENLLAECISLAIPRSKSSGKVATTSAASGPLQVVARCKSEDGIKQLASAEPARNDPAAAAAVFSQRSQFQFAPPRVAAAVPPVAIAAATVNATTTTASQNRQLSVGNYGDLSGFDSPRKFETEGTPLNYSQMGSYSDLSSVAGDCSKDDSGGALHNESSVVVTTATAAAAAEEEATVSVNQSGGGGDGAGGAGDSVDQPQVSVSKQLDDSIGDDLDVSLSDEGSEDEELLSKVIAAAMPKSRKPWKEPVVPASASNSSHPRGRQPSTSPVISGSARRNSKSLDPPQQRMGTEQAVSSRNFHGNKPVSMDSKGPVALLADKRKQSLDSNVSVSSNLNATTQKALPAAKSSATTASTTSWANGRSVEMSPSDDNFVSYAVEDTPVSFSRERSPFATRKLLAEQINAAAGGDRSWNSSLSSLSFDSSLNAEPTAAESALLEECINAAMPKAQGKKAFKKVPPTAAVNHQPLRTSPSGSSESSLKRNPATSFTSAPQRSMLSNGIEVSSGAKHSQKFAAAAADRKVDKKDRQTADKVDSIGPPKLASKSTVVADVRQSAVDNTTRTRANISEVSGAISNFVESMKENLPDVCPSDSLIEDDGLASGQNTEANNTVIYLGPLPQATSPNGKPDFINTSSMSSLCVKTADYVVDTKKTQKITPQHSEVPQVTDDVVGRRSSLDPNMSLLMSSTPNSASERPGPRSTKPSSSRDSAITDSVSKPKTAAHSRRKSLQTKSPQVAGSPKSVPKVASSDGSPLTVASSSSAVRSPASVRATPPNVKKLSFDGSSGNSPSSPTSPQLSSPTNRQRSLSLEKGVSSPLLLHSNRSNASSRSPMPSTPGGNNRPTKLSPATTAKSPRSVASPPTSHKSLISAQQQQSVATRPINSPGRMRRNLSMDSTSSPAADRSSTGRKEESSTSSVRDDRRRSESRASGAATPEVSSSSADKRNGLQPPTLRHSPTFVVASPLSSEVARSDCMHDLIQASMSNNDGPTRPGASSATYSQISSDTESQTDGSSITKHSTAELSAIIRERSLADLALKSALTNARLTSSGKSATRISSKSASSSPIMLRKNVLAATTKSNPLLNAIDQQKETLPGKKVAKSKISSLWKRDKDSKTDSAAAKGSLPSNVVHEKEADDKESRHHKSRDGLGKSPKSFRKSFPLRRSKKNALTSVEIPPEMTNSSPSRLMRSGTYDKLTADTAGSSDASDVSNLTSSSALPCADCCEDHEPAKYLPDVTCCHDDSKVTTHKRRGLFKLLGIEPRSKSKDSKTKYSCKAAEADQAILAQATSKKKFFWQKDSAKKSGKEDKELSHGADEDMIWVKNSDGQEIVKSATLPPGVMHSIVSNNDDPMTTSVTSSGGRKIAQSITVHTLFPSSPTDFTGDEVFSAVGDESSSAVKSNSQERCKHNRNIGSDVMNRQRETNVDLDDTISDNSNIVTTV